MQTSADYVTECCFVLLVPPVMTVIIVVWVFIWMGLALYVYSNGTWNCKAATP